MSIVYGMDGGHDSLHGTWYLRKEKSSAQLHTVTEELLEKDVSMILLMVITRYIQQIVI